MCPAPARGLLALGTSVRLMLSKRPWPFWCVDNKSSVLQSAVTLRDPGGVPTVDETRPRSFRMEWEPRPCSRVCLLGEHGQYWEMPPAGSFYGPETIRHSRRDQSEHFSVRM